MDYNIIEKAFHDELAKIAGSLQGHVRSGRRPLKAETLLEKEKDTKEVRKKLADMVKVSTGTDKGLRLTPGNMKALGLIAGGGYVYHTGRKMKRRYELGRQMELQQQGY